MVRLEKIVYEQLVNARQFGRARVIDRPRKWYNEARTPAMTAAAYKFFAQGLTGRIFRMVEPAVARFTYQWIRDYAQQRGLNMEDMIVFQDRELRRDPLFEAIARQSFHPYTWLLHAKRRARYYKVERGVRGSYAPEWTRQESDQWTLADAARNRYEWDQFVYDNFMSDMSPAPRHTILQRWIPLELFSFFGVFRMEAWDRFFYNEVIYSGTSYSQKDQAYELNGQSRFNLQTEDGRRRFEADVNRFIDLYPGAVVREGEKFDFDRFYALEALQNGRDLSRFDAQLVQGLRQELEGKVEHKKQQHSRSRSAGTRLPVWLGALPGKGIFA